MLRRYPAYFLAVLVLLTHVGLPVYTHVCRGMDRQWSSAVVPVKRCCGTSNKRAHRLKAPTEMAGQTSVAPVPCCEDRTEVAGLKGGFVPAPAGKAVPKLWHDVFTLLPEPGTPLYASDGFVAPPPPTFSHAPPWRLWGRSLLIAIQFFRL